METFCSLVDSSRKEIPGPCQSSVEDLWKSAARDFMIASREVKDAAAEVVRSSNFVICVSVLLRESLGPLDFVVL